MKPKVESQPSQPQRKLTLLDAVCIIVGTIIGSGIFGTASSVAGMLPDGYWVLGIWLAGGIVSLVGAFCFAELTTAHNATGGDYYYLSRAFGYPTGLAFAWAAFWIVRPGNIGAMAMIFAEYAVPIFGLADTLVAKLILAVASVVALSLMNVMGVRSGKVTQNVLTIIKVLGIVTIFVAATLHFSNLNLAETIASDATEKPLTSGALFISMVFVMFAYGGWNDIAFVSSEVKRPAVNLPWSLVLGTLTVTICYVGFNLALMLVLGFDGLVAHETRAPSEMMTVCSPRWGTSLLNALVCVSCLGAINGMIFTSPRIYYAVGQQYPKLSWLASWGGRRDGPWVGILCQAIISILLIVLCGMQTDGFEQILAATAPFFWGFLALTFVSLMVLRRSKEAEPGAFRVPLYPLPPIFMVMVSLAIVFSSVNYILIKEFYLVAAIVILLMAVGVVVAVLAKPKLP